MDNEQILECLCGAKAPPAKIEVTGTQYAAHMVAKTADRKHLGAVELLVCEHCGLVFCGLRGRVKKIGTQQTAV